MNKQQLDNVYDEFKARRYRGADILNDIQDSGLQIIKGHLLIEEALFELVKFKLSNPDYS